MSGIVIVAFAVCCFVAGVLIGAKLEYDYLSKECRFCAKCGKEKTNA